MAIPISDLITVSIAVSPNAVAVDGFGPVLFMTKEFSPTAGEVLPIRSYTSYAEVQADFPSGEINAAAMAWYSQKPTPKTFIVGAITSDQVVPATAGSLTSTKASTIEALKAITSGTMTVTVDRKTTTIRNVNLSGAADLAAANKIIDDALVAADSGVTSSQTTGKFALTTLATGSYAVIVDVSGNLAEVMNLTPASKPVFVAGKDEKSLQADLAKIAESPINFFYVGLERSYRGNRDGNQMIVAKWCEANGKVFGWADSDRTILTRGTENSFKQAKNQNLQKTICVFDASDSGDEYPELSILGRAATVNFNVANSTLVLAYKKGPSISTADLSSGQVAALASVNGNAFISVGGNTMFWNGKMSDGTWFDTVQGVEWLTQKVRNNVFNLFYTSTTKIPWTDTGVGMINQQITLALELAVTNGLIAPGYDNEGTFYPTGYKVLSTDLELMQSQKGERIWEGSSFIAIGAGALQGAVISGNFVQ